MATDLRNDTITQIVQSLKSRLSTAGQSGPLLFHCCREKGKNLADVMGGRINYTIKIGPQLNERVYIQPQTCFLKLRLGLRTRLYYSAYIRRKSWRLGQQLSRMLWLFRLGRFCLAGGVKVFIWRKVSPATDEVGPTIGKGWPAFSRANFFSSITYTVRTFCKEI